MFKTMALYKRRPGQTPQEFREYRVNVHLPLVKKLPGLRRYVQSNVPLELYAEGEPTVDGMVEVYFDSRQASDSAFATPEGKTARGDTPQYQDMANRISAVVERIVIKEGEAGPAHVKLAGWFRRKPNMTQEEFARYWRDVHGPLALKIPGLRRYVQNVPLPPTQADPKPADFDGCAELWFDSLAAFRAAEKSPEMAVAFKDIENFMDASTFKSAILHEEILVG